VLGGAKISGKIDLISALLPKVDHILLGGAMACTFFAAMGLETGNSLIERDRIELARRLLADSSGKLVVPSGAVVARELKAGADTRTVNRDRACHGCGNRQRGGDGGRRGRFGGRGITGGTGRQHHPRLDRRRSVAGVPGG
jgi:3-phosphoglycerate kinase